MRGLRRGIVVVVYAAIIAVWEAYGLLHQEPAAIIIAPTQILQTIWEMRTAILINTGTTLAEAGAGLLIAVIVGIVAALVIDRFRFFGEGIYHLGLLISAIPIIALAAPVVAWLGIGFWSKVVIVVTAACFPVIVNLTTALRTLDPRVDELGRVLNMGYLESLVRLRVNAVLPAFFASLKIAGPTAFVSAVIAEWLGAETGLGVGLENAMFTFKMDQLWALLVVVSVINILIVLVADVLGRVATPWHQSNSREVAL